MEDGTWSHDLPICKEITCIEPNVTEYVLVNTTSQSVGSLAKFTCAKGRFIVGNDTRTCLTTGLWSGKSPTCKPFDCGQPGQIENGRVIVVNDSTLYGGSAEYHCVPHFNRIGPYLRKCMEDGKWSGDQPRCERELAFADCFLYFYYECFPFPIVAINDAQESSGLGTGIAISAAIIVILLILIGILFLHR